MSWPEATFYSFVALLTSVLLRDLREAYIARRHVKSEAEVEKRLVMQLVKLAKTEALLKTAKGKLNEAETKLVSIKDAAHLVKPK